MGADNFFRRLPPHNADGAPFCPYTPCKQDQAIAEAIITLAQNLGLGVLAEAVETKAQVGR